MTLDSAISVTFAVDGPSMRTSVVPEATGPELDVRELDVRRRAIADMKSSGFAKAGDVFAGLLHVSDIHA